MTTELEVVKKLEQTAPKVVKMAESLVIKTSEDSKSAFEVLKEIKTFIRDAESYWKDPVANARKAWQTIKDKENEMVNPAKKAESTIKEKIAEWDKKQEIARQALQSKIEAEQKDKADKLLERARKAEEKGNTATADALREKAANLEAMTAIAPEAEKQEGKSTRYKYTGAIQTPDLIPDQFWCPDQKEIDAYLQRTEGSRPIPGVKIIKTPIISVRI